MAHRGYRLPDDVAKRRASRAASLLIGAVIAIGTWTAYALLPLLESEETGLHEVLGALLAPGGALLGVVVFYFLWASRFVEGFPESDLRVSQEERLREAAALIEPWKVALIGVLVCGMSALLIWLDPRTWWLGALGVALGIGALWWSSLLRRALAERSSEP